jgi:lipoic acid synthetase
MLRIRVIGRAPYEEALDLQRALASRAVDDYVLVLEHPHTYTLGVRGDPAHVLTDPEAVGARLVRVDRGGDVTYHGPGQLVVYPIVTVPDDPGSGRRHVHLLEEVVIDVLGALGVGGPDARVGRRDGYPGVWIGVGTSSPRKIAAVGVRIVRASDGRRRTLHGVALNVECDLAMFAHIVPCGITDAAVTSLRSEGCPASMAEVVSAMLIRAAAAWGAGNAEVQSVAWPDRSRSGGSAAAGAGVRGGVRDGRESPAETSGASVGPPSWRRLERAGVDVGARVSLSARKPPWLRAPARMGGRYVQTGREVHGLGLATVCEEAGCPNIFECWSAGTATFMVNGTRCTRACGFCQVDTQRPLPLDPGEPERVARAVRRMGLSHAVVTCVARDDLPDGGAAAIADTVEAIRRNAPGTAVEVLISDFRGDAAALAMVLDVRPDVLNHNVETVARLQRAVRPSAGYARSLTVLARAADAGLTVKSGLMVGLGEREDEVVATLADLCSVGASIATIGQYLRPTRSHLPVARWWEEGEFARLAEIGRELGLAHVVASPLTRSSYHAGAAAQAATQDGSGAALGGPGVPVSAVGGPS